jgi:predicted phosphodiesterase
MNGRFDPRRDMSALRPEYRRADYYDYVVTDMAKQLSKYAKNIVMITPGNHETSVLKNANTFLTDRLVSTLNTQYQGGGIIHGGYGGWIRIVLRKYNLPSGIVKIKYFHGAGGEAPVTRGAIQTNRQAVFLPDADIIVNGHSHNAYWIPITRERIGGKGDHYFDVQHHVRTPGYNQSYGDGSTGWEVTRGGVPKPLGGCFIKISANTNTKRPQITIEPLIHEPIPVSPVVDLFQGVVFPQE